MTSWLIRLLGVLLSSQAVISQFQPKAGFQLQPMAGKWYVIGYATNHPWFLERKDTMKMGVKTLEPNADGDVMISYASLNPDGTCWRFSNLAKKTGTPGNFYFTNWGYKISMTVVDVKYDEYALIYKKKENSQETVNVTKLYGRTNEVSDAIKKRWKEISAQVGILPENTVFLPKNGECPPA